jgi:hypothetical protein
MAEPWVEATVFTRRAIESPYLPRIGMAKPWSTGESVVQPIITLI